MYNACRLNQRKRRNRLLSNVMNQYITFLGPLVGMMLGVIIRMIVDDRLRQILSTKGLNPNPTELDANFKKIYITPTERFAKMKADIQFRKGISSSCGSWYLGSLILHGIMFLYFAVLIFIVK